MLVLSALFAAIALVAGVLGIGGADLVPPSAAVGTFGLSVVLFLVTLTAGLMNADFDVSSRTQQSR